MRPEPWKFTKFDWAMVTVFTIVTAVWLVIIEFILWQVALFFHAVM